MQLYGSLQNRIMESSKQPVPECGMGATLTSYTDRHACTVIGITQKHGRVIQIEVQEDKAIRTDDNGMSDSQDYRYEPNPKGITHIFRLNKKGVWKQASFNEQTKRWNVRDGYGLLLGVRRHYHDYSF